MSSKSTYEYYKDDFKKMSPLRASAESLFCHHNDAFRIERVTPRRAYELARSQEGVTTTDMPIYAEAAKRLGLPDGACILNDNHGAIVGRNAGARKFYDRSSTHMRRKLEEIVREAIWNLEKKELIEGQVVVGLDHDLMLKARMITLKSDANNLWNWYHNFVPYDFYEVQYKHSLPLPLQDILVIADPTWTSSESEFKEGLVVVDPYENLIFSFGMRYFGERKKGTLTLAWTSGMRLGQIACHAGIKEIDFTACEDKKYHPLQKRSVAFFGLSGSGKSSHTNSHDHGGTLPKGFKRTILHDDAFQIDLKDRVCRVWEPTLFDKTDSRGLDHKDWKYCISSQNNAVMEIEGKTRILALDVRNANGRCIFDRDLLGQNAYVNRCNFPYALCWLMKDETLPPILRLADPYLAVAMGATLMTKRTAAENVSLEEMKKLVFEPFANPFRVYELYKDCEGFMKVFESGAHCYTFNSGGFWGGFEKPEVKIPLATSLRLSTALLCDELQWEKWDMLPGALIPTAASVDAILPGYSTLYNLKNIPDRKEYETLLSDRFCQRREFLKNSDIKDKPDLLLRLVKAL